MAPRRCGAVFGFLFICLFFSSNFRTDINDCSMRSSASQKRKEQRQQKKPYVEDDVRISIVELAVVADGPLRDLELDDSPDLKAYLLSRLLPRWLGLC